MCVRLAQREGEETVPAQYTKQEHGVDTQSILTRSAGTGHHLIWEASMYRTTLLRCWPRIRYLAGGWHRESVPAPMVLSTGRAAVADVSAGATALVLRLGGLGEQWHAAASPGAYMFRLCAGARHHPAACRRRARIAPVSHAPLIACFRSVMVPGGVRLTK